MRIEKLLQRYLRRELLQCTVDDLCRAQERAGAAVLLEIGQRIGRVSRTQGNAPHRNDLHYLPLNTRHHLTTSSADEAQGCRIGLRAAATWRAVASTG